MYANIYEQTTFSSNENPNQVLSLAENPVKLQNRDSEFEPHQYHIPIG